MKKSHLKSSFTQPRNPVTILSNLEITVQCWYSNRKMPSRRNPQALLILQLDDPPQYPKKPSTSSVTILYYWIGPHGASVRLISRIWQRSLHDTIFRYHLTHYSPRHKVGYGTLPWDTTRTFHTDPQFLLQAPTKNALKQARPKTGRLVPHKLNTITILYPMLEGADYPPGAEIPDYQYNISHICSSQVYNTCTTNTRYNVRAGHITSTQQIPSRCCWGSSSVLHHRPWLVVVDLASNCCAHWRDTHNCMTSAVFSLTHRNSNSSPGCKLYLKEGY